MILSHLTDNTTILHDGIVLIAVRLTFVHIRVAHLLLYHCSFDSDVSIRVNYLRFWPVVSGWWARFKCCTAKLRMGAYLFNESHVRRLAPEYILNFVP